MKKTLAILLSLALVICMIPATAFGTTTYAFDSNYVKTFVYNGNPQAPTLEVKKTDDSGTSQPVSTTDYVLKYRTKNGDNYGEPQDTKPINAGTYKVSAYSVGETGTLLCENAEFTIQPYNYNTNKITIGIDNQVNDVTSFDAIKGSFHYYKDGKEVSSTEKAFLEKGVNGSAPSKVGETDQYKVSFEKATGNFDGTIPEAYYKKAKDIDSATVSPKSGYTISGNTINAGTYNGQTKNVTSMFELKDGSSTIDPINYTISCVEDKTKKEVYAPKNAGTYTISIKGKEAYGNTKLLYLEIAAKDATKTVTIDTITETYVAGKWENLEPVVRDTSLGKLTRGVDYIMKEPTSSGNVGTVVFEFKGNYAGTKSANFKVVSPEYDIDKVANVTFISGYSYLTKSVMYSGKTPAIAELQTMSVKKSDGTSLGGYYTVKYGYKTEDVTYSF